MNQKHLQSSFTNKPLQNRNRVRENVAPSHLSDPLSHFVWQHEIKKVLSPYWALRSAS